MLVAHGIPVKAGTADVSVILRVIDSTDGTPETAVDHATSGIDLKYWREGGSVVDITEAALAALTTAHTDGGVEQIGAGYIRVDVPDAAFAGGATSVQVFGNITGMVVLGATIPLVAYDPQDTVRLGLTALPNAAAAASGGLFTRGTGAGQINQDANGRIDANMVAESGVLLTAAGAIPRRGIVDQGTLQSGSATGAVLRSALSLANDIPLGAMLSIVAGTGAGQSSEIIDFVGSTDTVTIGATWTTTPDNTSEYIVWMGPLPNTLAPAVNVTHVKGRSLELAGSDNPQYGVNP